MINDHTITLSDGVAQIAFDIVAHVQDADYSWSAEAVLRRHSDGAMFYVEDGGCSCNGFGDYLTVADLKPIHKFAEALALTSDRERLQKSYDQQEIEWRRSRSIGPHSPGLTRDRRPGRRVCCCGGCGVGGHPGADCRSGCSVVSGLSNEDRDDAIRLTEAFYAAQYETASATDPHNYGQMQAALRSLIEPPKPPEPTGLGAVVEDAEGTLWIRTHDVLAPWLRHNFTGSRYWPEVNAVRVLSEGVPS